MPGQFIHNPLERTTCLEIPAYRQAPIRSIRSRTSTYPLAKEDHRTALTFAHYRGETVLMAARHIQDRVCTLCPHFSSALTGLSVPGDDMKC